MSGKFAAIFSDPRAVNFFVTTIGKAFLDKYQSVKVALLRAMGIIDFPRHHRQPSGPRSP
jgi:hypothetical protein